MEKITPLPFQKDGVRAMEAFNGRAVLADEQGLGKAEPCSNIIPTPNGPTTMGQLKPGSVVLGLSGNPVRVLEIFPQGIIQTHKITFTDDTVVRCCGDHLWRLRDVYGRWYTLTVKEIIERGYLENTEPKFSIPRQGAAQYESKPTMLDPYYVGCLIANGCYVNNNCQFTCHTDDAEHFKGVIPWGRTVTRGNTTHSDYDIETLKTWRAGGLESQYSAEKTIPEIYLRNGIEERWELLRGLMDCDGSVADRGAGMHTYFTSSHALALDVQELACGLGCWARIAWYDREGGKREYCVDIDAPECPFKLPRKAGPWRPLLHPRRKSIKNIELDTEEECQCIMVDAPDHLYQTGRSHTVTHNTFQALWFLKRNPDTWPAVVVSPGVAKWVWAEEASRLLAIRADVCVGTMVPRYAPVTPPRLVVVNYEILEAWLPYLLALNPQTVIFDECQYLANPEAKRTIAGRELARTCPNVLALSGTPIVNRPREFYPILNMVRPDVFNSFNDYAHRYCKPTYKPWGWTYDGAENLDELHTRLREICMVRRLKKNVLDLPDKHRHVIQVPIRDRAQYTRANDDFMVWLRSTFGAHKAAKAAKAERMVRMGYMKRLAAKLKAPSVTDYANANMMDGKLVMFGYHEKMIRAMERRIVPETVTIDGGTTDRDRPVITRRFQTQGNVRGFLGSTAAITAITLTAANRVGMAELYWRPGDHLQAEDRCHRIGQTKEVNIDYLVAENTIEEHVAAVLQAKQRDINAGLDGGQGNEMNIYDEITERMLE